MKLSQISHVLGVAETGSLRSASRMLGIIQSTMSRSISDIEHEFGVALFTRHANGVTPTDMGDCLSGGPWPFSRRFDGSTKTYRVRRIAIATGGFS